MAITFIYEIQGNLLRVKTSGSDDGLEEVRRYGYALLAIANEHSCSKLHCDERELIYNLSVMDMYKLAETASKEAKGLKRIAVVCNERYVGPASFYETVARNRGLAIIVTADVNKAEEWLDELE